ncbi:GNAT family N-acetyltransferase [Acaricomes phytoseiuli]|uniref:GNAT family N-acetyltransferase n=1 Tax=Acaricomes phytoseiuli TaxID=291968 RepID=UPI00036F84AD|nr:GNAT family N-acetyltransferase [Acaricomes phytoseiuli]MCW1249117.1 GNAT family N-acetyltransferase [Acaricomes phytoseiuli]
MTLQDLGEWSALYTARLLFRRPVSSDLEVALEIHTDPATNLHHPRPELTDAEHSAERFEEMLQHWSDHGFGVWVVAERENPARVIGFTGVSHRTVHGRAALNLYYRYRPDVWGQGYAAEGARLAVARAQSLLAPLPVIAHTVASNIGSQKTALKAGLERHPELDVDHGEFTDVYFATDWC